MQQLQLLYKQQVATVDYLLLDIIVKSAIIAFRIVLDDA
jgi:hypothetical protein